MQKLKVLLKGQTINLCKPTSQFAGGDIWYKWLNNPTIIRNLEDTYKRSRNTKKKQINFFKNQKKKKKNFYSF